jgi:pimeloyl-ACP methyl ester carboxylesterase
VSSGSVARVFVVDDEPVIASTLAAILKLHGYSATSFTSPLEALAVARSKAPDLLISDVAMRGVSGIDLAIQDELLTNIMFYWVSQTIGSSLRYYREDALSPSLKTGERVTVPTGVGVLSHDLSPVPPRSLGERMLNVKRWVEIPHGGHFTAWEEPKLLAEEIRTFFADYRV